MLIMDVFDSLSDHLEKGYSCYRKMRGSDPNGFNYDTVSYTHLRMHKPIVKTPQTENSI